MPKGWSDLPRLEYQPSLESRYFRRRFAGQLSRIGGGGQAAQHFLRSLLVVLTPPRLNDGLCMSEIEKPMFVQALIKGASWNAG